MDFEMLNGVGAGSGELLLLLLFSQFVLCN